MLNRNMTIGVVAVLAISVLIAITMNGSNKETQKPTEQTSHYASAFLMTDPMPLKRAETVTQLLPVWRKYRNQAPTLLLISNNPHLTPLADDKKIDVSQLLVRGDTQEIIQAGNSQQPSPLFTSASVTDIALNNQWFSRLAWALPILNPAQELDLDQFRKQMIATQSMSEVEAETLTLEDRFFRGKLRDQDFSAAALPLHQNITGPVVVHIDLSYFQPIYKNEMTTPLLKLIHLTMSTLKKMHLKTLAITFSYGHLDEQIALDVRFVGDILNYLIEDPTRLDQEIPINWQRQSEAMYQANIFQKEKVRELYMAQEMDEPDAAWIKYNLYKSALADNAGQQALEFLKQAVTIDHIYALEYLDLGNEAYRNERYPEAIRYFTLASQSLPGNAQIKQQLEHINAEASGIK